MLQVQEQRAECAVALSTAELERADSCSPRRQSPRRRSSISPRPIPTATRLRWRKCAARSRSRRWPRARRTRGRARVAAAAQARAQRAETRLDAPQARSPVSGTVQQIYYRPGEMVPAGRPVVSLLPPGNLKVRFFVPKPMLPQIALGDTVEVTLRRLREPIAAKVSFIARSAEFTPPVIYSLEERSQARVPDRGAPETARRAARRPAGRASRCRGEQTAQVNGATPRHRRSMSRA